MITSDRATRVLEGPAVFARYAYPPNALGYCGGEDPAALLGAGDEHPDVALLRDRAQRFEGAWPYLQLIAACNDIADPLDVRVTRAYWIGNGLLGRVRPSVFAASLEERFSRRAGRNFAPLVETVPSGGLPHHSFHVFAVYPWLGMLRAGREGPALEVLDRCRIRWGRVLSVMGDHVVVANRRLGFDGSRLVLGDERIEQARVGERGNFLVRDLRPGDRVSLHWDWVCDRLTPEDLRRLRHYSALSLEVVNRQARPGPAVAADTFG